MSVKRVVSNERAVITDQVVTPDREQGAGTVLLLGVAAVVLLFGLALAALGAAQHSRAIAQTAADLGAIGAATAIQWGLEPCSVANELVARNGAMLVTCEQQAGGVVVVQISAGRAKAQARAGPRL